MKLRHLLLGSKAMTNINRILKSRDINLLTKVYTVKAMVFPVVMYGCKSWTIKKAEHKRIDAFELGCWKKHESLLNCRETKPANSKGNQSWIFTGRIDAEAGTLILWPPDAKNRLTRKDPDWERLKAGGEGDDRGWDSWMASPTQWTWDWVGSRNWWWTKKPGVLQSWGHEELDTTERLNSLKSVVVVCVWQPSTGRVCGQLWEYSDGVSPELCG